MHRMKENYGRTAENKIDKNGGETERQQPEKDSETKTTARRKTMQVAKHFTRKSIRMKATMMNDIQCLKCC
jgi:hypothetical protein